MEKLNPKRPYFTFEYKFPSDKPPKKKKKIQHTQQSTEAHSGVEHANGRAQIYSPCFGHVPSINLPARTKWPQEGPAGHTWPLRAGQSNGSNRTLSQRTRAVCAKLSACVLGWLWPSMVLYSKFD